MIYLCSQQVRYISVSVSMNMPVNTIALKKCQICLSNLCFVFVMLLLDSAGGEVTGDEGGKDAIKVWGWI